MQLPSIDRIPGTRPVAVETASLSTGRVVPAAPVNASEKRPLTVEPTPSVVNLINQANKPNTGEGVYVSVSDPSRKDSLAYGSPKDWTIHQPRAEKPEKPPPEPPLYKLLIDHVKSLWQASATAVQVQDQVRNQVDPAVRQGGVQAAQSVMGTQEITYHPPNKINQTEKTGL
ncbi:MAG: hypothetical protein OHK0048_19020 [Rhodoferax sp.]